MGYVGRAHGGGGERKKGEGRENEEGKGVRRLKSESFLIRP